MHPKNNSASRLLMTFVLSFMIFGTLASGAATAADGKSGSWVNKTYSIKGGWSIEKRGDQHVISFNDSFSTKGGPDLKLFLSPQSVNTVTGSNATKNAVLVAPLKRSSGTQEYVLPAGIDINSFKSLLIHCEAYSVIWGGANL